MDLTFVAVSLAAMFTPALAQQAAPAQQAAQAQTNLSPTTAQPPTRLRITTWNLAGSLPAKLERQFERAKPVWRTTFGARKAKTTGPNSSPPKIAADVIALQSVTDMRIVRRLFPARRYHVIVSRQLLLNAVRIKEQRATAISRHKSDKPATPGAKTPVGTSSKNTFQKTIGTTAIAIRRGSGIRLTRQEHLIAFAGISLRNPNLPYRAAALALRLSRVGQKYWVISLDLIEGCGKNRDPQSTSACKILDQQTALLATWLKAKRALGEKVIMAGSFGRPIQYTTTAAKKTSDMSNIWPILNSAMADQKPGVVIAARVATGLASRRSSRAKLPPIPGTATSPAIGARLLGFPAKPHAGCTEQSPAMSDYILADSGGANSPEYSKGWITAYPKARHCPITLDIAF